MRLDRVAEDVFILVSEMYAQVTSTVVFTDEGCVVVDTTPFPAETREVLSFVEERAGPGQVRYLILTHHHPDHVYGAYLFEGSEIVAQDGCREVLQRSGAANLERARRNAPALAEVVLRLPDITFQRQMHLHVGNRHLWLMHTPGHSSDSSSVLIVDEKVLVAGDTVMPVPYLVGGDLEAFSRSLERVQALQPSFVIQGHGDVLLRGEVDETIQASIDYLGAIAEAVQQAVERGDPPSKLREIDIESCGKSRIPLDGMVSKLHQENLRALYRRFKQQAA